MKMLGKVVVGVVSESRKFSGNPYIYGASRDHLCDSTVLLLFFILQSSVVGSLSMQGMRRKMYVDGRPCFVGYLLCVVVVLETATAEQTFRLQSLQGGLDGEVMTVPVRRHAFSVTHDLQMLTKMLSDESHRRRMQNAEAFFNALHKRPLQPLKQPMPAVPGQNVLSDKRMNAGLRRLRFIAA